MRLVMPYLPTDDDGDSLRHALRSWDTFFHPADGSELEVTIAGEWIPQWLRDVDFVQCIPNEEFKQQAIAKKMLAACEHITEDEFIYCEDDQFLLDHQTSVTVVDYGSMAEHARRTRGWYPIEDPWPISLTATDRYIFQRGITGALSYEIHRPYPFQREPLMGVLNQIIESKGPVWFKTVYGAFVRFPHTYTGRDGKGPSSKGTGLPLGVHWLSVYENVQNHKTIRKVLEKPSRWERT